MTISRFLAEKFNIAGKNDIEKAQASAIADHVVDVRAGVFTTLQIKNPEEKKQAWTKLVNETVPHMLKLIQNILEANPAKKGFLVIALLINSGNN